MACSCKLVYVYVCVYHFVHVVLWRAVFVFFYLWIGWYVVVLAQLSVLRPSPVYIYVFDIIIFVYLETPCKYNTDKKQNGLS